MDYSKEILTFLDSEIDFGEWLNQYPLEEHINLINTFREFVTKVALENGNFELVQSLAETQDQLQEYEDAVITELAAKQKYDEAQKQLDESMKQLDETVAGVRHYVMECILTNDFNAKEMMELAKKMIYSEKLHEIYDENNWKPILHLLH